MKIRFTIEDNYDFTVEDIWPDGHAPDPITQDAVMARIALTYGDINAFVNQRCLDAGAGHLYVTMIPEAADIPVIVGDLRDSISVEGEDDDAYNDNPED